MRRAVAIRTPGTSTCARVTLANFDYRTMSLVRDYRELLADGLTTASFERLFSLEPRPLPAADVAEVPLVDRYLVLPSDGSQIAAIGHARGGESLVIQGPPGTGKSQTITNLIADYVARGKRVLFVCQKRAAIDVVHARLRQRGLDDLASLIHDSQADKQCVRDAAQADVRVVARGRRRSRGARKLVAGRSSTGWRPPSRRSRRTRRASRSRSSRAARRCARSSSAWCDLRAQRWGDELPGAAAGRPVSGGVVGRPAGRRRRSPPRSSVPVRTPGCPPARSGSWPEACWTRSGPRPRSPPRRHRWRPSSGRSSGRSTTPAPRPTPRRRPMPRTCALRPPRRSPSWGRSSCRSRVEGARRSSGAPRRPPRSFGSTRRQDAALEAALAKARADAAGWHTPLSPDDARAALAIATAKEGSFLRFLDGGWRRVKAAVGASYTSGDAPCR